jgi:hypothetical protein
MFRKPKRSRNLNISESRTIEVGPYDDEPEDAFVSKRVTTSELLPAIGEVRRRLSGGSGPLPPSTGGSSASARCRSDGLQPPELQTGGA